MLAKGSAWSRSTGAVLLEVYSIEVYIVHGECPNLLFFALAPNLRALLPSCKPSALQNFENAHMLNRLYQLCQTVLLHLRSQFSMQQQQQICRVYIDSLQARTYTKQPEGLTIDHVT